MQSIPYLYVTRDFNQSSFEAELLCGSQTCFQMSISESKICKPFVKPTKTLGNVMLFLLILYAVSFLLMVCIDFVVIKLPRDEHQKADSLGSALFTLLFAGTILGLSSKSFESHLFCSMNYKEKICEKQRNYKHEGALHTIDDPIYVSAPCKVSSKEYEKIHFNNSDILHITQEVSPCTFELRSEFFIEYFEMEESISPNSFVLLKDEPLKFSSDLNFYSWSKPGSRI